MEEIPNNVEGKAFEDEVKKMGIPMPTAGMDSIKDKCFKSVHTALQTETMLDACIWAKRSCFWAAVAAFVSAVSAIAALITVFGN